MKKNRKSNGQTENWIDRQEYRGTHTQTDRQIDTQNAQKNRQMDIINTDRMMERQTYIQKYRHTDMKRWNDKHTYEQRGNEQMDRQMDIETEKEREDESMDRQKYRWTK